MMVIHDTLTFNIYLKSAELIKLRYISNIFQHNICWQIYSQNRYRNNYVDDLDMLSWGINLYFNYIQKLIMIKEHVEICDKRYFKKKLWNIN